MDIYKETDIKITFDEGGDITPIIVFDGVEMVDKYETFNKATHQVEELLKHVTHWENSGCDVYV